VTVRSAIRTGAIDYVLPPEAIAGKSRRSPVISAISARTEPRLSVRGQSH
jgi:hypothetical protein